MAFTNVEENWFNKSIIKMVNLQKYKKVRTSDFSINVFFYFTRSSTAVKFSVQFLKY